MNVRSIKAYVVLVVLAIVLCDSAPHTPAARSSNAENSTFDRLLTEQVISVFVENPSGRTLVQTWDSLHVRITASRSPSPGKGDSLTDRIRFETAAGALKINVTQVPRESPVALTVFVPAHINLAVRGGGESVTVKGATASMSVETAAGGISLYLPSQMGADLSLRAVEGSITARLPLTIFGAVEAHSLDGKLGRGGTPVILRSARGSIELLPDDPARLAEQSNRPANPSEPKTRQASLGISQDIRAGGDEMRATDSNASAAIPVNDDEVIEVNTRLISLNARVTDAAGKMIPDLTKDDFQIFEDGVEQAVVHFEPITAPVGLVLLLDLSGSTKDHMKVMKKAANKFIDSLNPNTSIAVAAFTRKFMLISDFTQDRELLKERIDDARNFQAGTAFYDAMWATLDLLEEVRERRKAVVVLTDGVDNSLSDDDYQPRHPFNDLIKRMAEEEVTIYPIYFDTEYEVTVRGRGQDTHESYVTARRQLQRIADDTGGTLFRADRADDLEAAYGRVASELHTLYSAAYNPRNDNFDGRWRNVSIKLKRRPGTVRTRRGYYAK